VTRELHKIGITVTVRHPKPDDFPGEGVFDAKSDVDLVSWGSGGPTADAVTALGGLYDLSWLGKDTLNQLDQLATMSGPARDQAVIEFANRLTKQDYVIVPYDYAVFPFFTSEHVGCGFVQQAVGAVDLLSLCFKEGAAPTPTLSP
jgi:hypothetical protein